MKEDAKRHHAIRLLMGLTILLTMVTLAITAAYTSAKYAFTLTDSVEVTVNSSEGG